MGDRHKKRGGHNKVDLTGRNFGKLSVVCDTGRRKSRRPIWLCKCECGNTIDVLSKYLLNGDTQSCGCITQGNAHNRTGYKGLGGTYWYHVKSNAKRRGVPFNLTPQQAYELFEQQNGQCALTGTSIVLVNNYRDNTKGQTASLDRIDNTRGYEIGNIQWVHKIVNIMRNNMTVEEFIKWCAAVVSYKGEQNA